MSTTTTTATTAAKNNEEETEDTNPLHYKPVKSFKTRYKDKDGKPVQPTAGSGMNVSPNTQYRSGTLPQDTNTQIMDFYNKDTGETVQQNIKNITALEVTVAPNSSGQTTVTYSFDSKDENVPYVFKQTHFFRGTLSINDAKTNSVYNKMLTDANNAYKQKQLQQYESQGFMPKFGTSGIGQIQLPGVSVSTHQQMYNEQAQASNQNQQDQLVRANDMGTNARDIHSDNKNLEAMMYDYNTNVARENRYGENLNGMSFNATRNLSRAADRLNNREWWNGGEAGAYSFRNGTVSGSNGFAYKKQPIETQEMRQMRMQEGLENQQLNADLNRADKVRNRPVELGIRQAELDFNTIQSILEGNQEVFNQLQLNLDKIKRLDPSSTQNQMVLQEFMTYLGINKSTYIYNLINSIGEFDGWANALVAAGVFGASLSNVSTKSIYQEQAVIQWLRTHPDDWSGAASVSAEFNRTAENAYEAGSE